MYVTVISRNGFDRTYKADDWRIGPNENLAVLEGGKVIATHAGGTWESVYVSEAENA